MGPLTPAKHPGPPSIEDRVRWLEQLGDREAHDEIAGQLECLTEPELGRAPLPLEATGWLRIAAWNVERGRHPAEAAALIRATGAQVALLSELDSGMARTGNRDVHKEIAAALGYGFAFGVEFVELGLGDAQEAAACVGQQNECGLHGNAIMASVDIRDVVMVPMGPGGDWFDAARNQPRIGRRMAVVGTVKLEGVDVIVASVHIESHSDAGSRADQMVVLLEAIDDRGHGPAVIGGDFNTVGASIEELADRTIARRLRDAEPTRFSWPVSREPLFAAAARHGFEWVDANVAAPTTRHRPDGLPAHPPLKLDWILVRGLEAARPTVVPAIGSGGAALSDHDLVAVSVRLARRSA